MLLFQVSVHWGHLKLGPIIRLAPTQGAQGAGHWTQGAIGARIVYLLVHPEEAVKLALEKWCIRCNATSFLELS